MPAPSVALLRPAPHLRDDRTRHLLAALHDRDRRSLAARVVHERLLLRALQAKPGR